MKPSSKPKVAGRIIPAPPGTRVVQAGGGFTLTMRSTAAMDEAAVQSRKVRILEALQDAVRAIDAGELEPPDGD
ncbi:MAG: hypothetical protein Q8T13_05155 [Acidobacteriota bacterium]|nr:hypothetical protein [Acidobacteriota bacterium]